MVYEFQRKLYMACLHTVISGAKSHESLSRGNADTRQEINVLKSYILLVASKINKICSLRYSWTDSTLPIT